MRLPFWILLRVIHAPGWHNGGLNPLSSPAQLGRLEGQRYFQPSSTDIADITSSFALLNILFLPTTSITLPAGCTN